ncbi:molybdenum cofactor biosynthesis protein [Paenibacillus sp. FSL H8-0548]|uniref:molybdopterin molybdotransferase MoeA n=1 Tax=Paenibacillus sp. FSL H8-0548 TaxID=1920422 RepID=UPI00096D251E|nr:gephyrin-like molybdotransferase Glp [Paenibacillus sp. FSL H8-0548]OMF38881.1 molybdenum cofactor biosynthesis protein [Paenibacillus sp. FSL H8-0548]
MEQANSTGAGRTIGREGAGRFNRQAVKVSEAQERVLAAAAELQLGSELVPLRASGGRRLARALVATSDWPPFARSGLDGYAVRAADIAEASPGQPATLRVVDTVAAGGLALAAVEKGTAARIMTGAAVPVGADAVVMLEQTAEAMLADGSAAVLIKHAGAAGQHIAPQGEEFRLGGALAAPGTLVRPGHIALLGTFGYAEVPVCKRPRVAVFATGSELLPVAAPLAPGQIRDSNSCMVAAMIEQSGAEPILCGPLPDERAAVEEALAQAAAHADLIVTTGGVSVGDFDVMSDLFSSMKQGRIQGQVLFDRVAMRPGSPTSTAVVNGRLLIALSGNPGACFVGFELFARPALLRMQGVEAALPRTVMAQLLTAVDKPSPHERYVRSRLLYQADGRLLADPLAFSKSSMMASIADAEGLAVIPSGSRGADAGELIKVILLP